MNSPDDIEFGDLVADVAKEWAADPASKARLMLHEILDANQGALSVHQAEVLSTVSGRHERTIWRWQRDYLANSPDIEIPESDVSLEGTSSLDRMKLFGPSAFEFDDTMMALMYLLGGHQTRLHSELIAGGYEMPSLATVSRLWNKVPTLQRDGARHGLTNRSANLLHIRHSAANPNDAWQFDSFNLDIYCRLPHGKRPIRPWLLLLQDDCSRFITSWAVLPYQMRAAEVLACFGAGFDVRPDDEGSGVLIGGYPKKLIFDNEKAIVSKVVREALDALPPQCTATPAYTPTAKGKIERVGQTIQSAVVVGQPGQATQVAGPNGADMLAIAPGYLHSFDQIVERTRASVFEYNYQRPHSSLSGRTPFEVYSNNTPIRRPDDDELAPLMVPAYRAAGVRKVHPDGLHAYTTFYVDATISHLIHEEVNLTSWIHDHRRVAVHEGDTFVAMVPWSGDLTKEQREAVMQHRFDEMSAVRRHAKGARDAMRNISDGIVSPIDAVTTARPDTKAADGKKKAAGKNRQSAQPATTRPASRPAMKKDASTRTKAKKQESAAATRARQVAEQALDAATSKERK